MQKADLIDQVIDILACPACRGELERIDSKTLLCAACGLRCFIRDGLPVLRANVTK